MRLIAIGDIHGQAWKLRDLLTQIHELSLAEEDRLIFLGDYIDRGPEVRLTIDLQLRVAEERPNTVFLRGNHDEGMMQARDYLDPRRETSVPRDEFSWWFEHGGEVTIRSYGGGPQWFRQVPDKHWAFLEATQMEYREGGYIFVHAGLLPPGRGWGHKADPRLWVRHEFLESDFDFGGTVVYGHTPRLDGMPVVSPGRISLDTAAAYGGPLTAAILVPFQPEAVTFLRAH